MQEPEARFYGRFPFARICFLAGPLLVGLGVATYVLVTTQSPTMTLAAQVASAIVGFALIVLLALSVFYAAMVQKPMLTLTASGLQRWDLTLRWDDVSNIEIQRHSGQSLIALTLRDPEAFLKAIPGYVAIGYALQFNRTRNNILVPAMRELSLQRLYDLIQEYWKNRAEGGLEMSAPSSAAYVPPRTIETAAMFASCVLGIFLLLRWLDLIDYARNGNFAALLMNAAYAVGATGAAYVLSLVVLGRVRKKRPGFDVWQKLAIPQELLGGVDTTFYDALDGRRRVRSESYIARLQKAPWRFILYCGLLGSMGLLISSGLFFIGMFLIGRGPSSRAAEAFASARPLWIFEMVLLLPTLALVLIAFLKLRYPRKPSS